MPDISDLRLQGYRCLADQRVQLGPRCNWVYGDNAAGKTSLLEAVYWLGRGRSFRTARPEQCRRTQASGWAVSAAVHARIEAPADHLRAVWSDGVLSHYCNEARTTLVEQAKRLPVQLVEPGMHRLVEDGPAYRRRFLDWGMFHVEPDYLDAWRRYARALRQRNAQLRQPGGDRELIAWTHELAAAGERLHSLRAEGVHRLQQCFSERCEALGLPPAEVELSAGWSGDGVLQQQLEERIARDRRSGHTSLGPHRAELRVSVEEQQARAHISRGQQKMLLVAMHLALADLLHAASGHWPVLLLDDFTAELAQRLQQHLADSLGAYRGQSIITSLWPPEGGLLTDNAAVFHVERGALRAVRGPSAAAAI